MYSDFRYTPRRKLPLKTIIFAAQDITYMIPTWPEEEQRLIGKIADGDEQAFTELYNRYHQQLGMYLFKITKSPELTQELVHDVFLKTWQNRATLTTIRDFRAYLFVVSKNMAINHLKKLAKENQERRELARQSNSNTYHEVHEANRYTTLLDEAIDRLPPQRKQVYILSKHRRLKYEEIAARLSISRETVKKHLQSAVRSITDYLKNHVDTTGMWLFYFFIFFY